MILLIICSTLKQYKCRPQSNKTNTKIISIKNNLAQSNAIPAIKHGNSTPSHQIIEITPTALGISPIACEKLAQPAQTTTGIIILTINYIVELLVSH